jgi:hypothetical protein
MIGARSSRAHTRIPVAAVGALVALGALGACGGRSDATSSGSSPRAAVDGGVVPAAVTCDASSATDIVVSSNDLNGFPPYAVAGCTLAYVNAAGDLVVRDLAAGTEAVVAPASEHPRRPAASTMLVAWEADEDGQSVVRIRAGGVVQTARGAFQAAGEPRASGASIVFTAWNGPTTADDTDVWLYDATADEPRARLAVGGPGQQRFADVSSDYVAVSDFGEDPDLRFDNDGKDLADVVVLERATGRIVPRRRAGKQAFPMLADGGVLAYLDWSGIHPEPKFVAYQLRSGAVLGDPAADRSIADVVYASSDYARPAVSRDMLEWIANPDGRTTLYRAPADGSTAALAVKGLEEFRLYAPSPTSAGFTVLAASRIGSAESLPRLRAVAR